MSIMGIIAATLVVGGTGLFIGLFLGVAGEKFSVEVDANEEKIRELLPGNNCGGCGYAGCDALAKAVAEGKAKPGSCPVGGINVGKKIGEIVGDSDDLAVKKVAFVKCKGDCEKTSKKYEYQGNMDCRQAAYLPGRGAKSCSYGCMGYGTCKKACPFGAIDIVDGIAVIDEEKCKACGKCVSVCPNHLIELIPYGAECRVSCSSKDKGKDVKAACQAGCIGCKMCERVCEHGAITVTDNVASIDYEKCTGCGKCKEKCPVKAID